MNSTVQTNPRELDQTSVWFQSEHLAYSLVQSSPGTFKLRRKPVQSDTVTVNFSQKRSYTDETDKVLSECRLFEWYFDA